MGAAHTGRREDQALLTGKGQFVTDARLPNQARAVFLRSDRAHADILSIDTTAARTMPGVLAILNEAELRPFNLGQIGGAFAILPGRNGSKMITPPKPVLAETRVRHVGEAIAIVIAETTAQAQDAAEQITVEYQDLPVVTSGTDALTQGAPQLWSEIPGNLALDFDFGNEEATNAAIAAAPHKVTVALDNTRVAVAPLEPMNCTAWWDGPSGLHEIHIPHQGINGSLGGLKAYFNEPVENFRVIARDVGGSFGARLPIYPEYAAILIGSRIIGRPVKWTATRNETFLSEYQGRSLLSAGTLAFDAEGKFLAIRYDWVPNVGSYPTDYGAAGICFNGMKGGIGPYTIPTIYGRVKVAVTNTVPTGAYRGAGRPETTAILEQLVDAAAADLGLDPAEIRRRNFIPSAAFPYKTPQGIVYDSGDHETLLAIAADKADLANFPARRAQAATEGKLRGIGITTFLEASAGAVPIKEQVELRVSGEGRVTLYAAANATGQGLATTFARIVTSELGIPDDKLDIRLSDPDGPRLSGAGAIGSRAGIVYGSGTTLAAREVRRKGIDLAAEALEASPGDIEFANGTFSITGTDRRIDLFTLAAQHPTVLDSIGEPSFGASFPGGAHIAEVEIDRDTGTLTLLRYIAVDDCGHAIEPMLVHGQIVGGIVQGIGQALGEHIIYDENGQLLAASFMDYTMPRADQFPAFELHDHNIPSPNNMLGAKGVGEAGTTGGLSTIISAVHDALRPAGITGLDMPYSPSRIWEALNGAALRGAA